MHIYPGSFTTQFVMRCLIRVLKSSPAAYIIDKNDFKVGLTRIDVLKQLLERSAPIDTQSAFTFIRVCPHNIKASFYGVAPYFRSLIVG